MSCLINKDTNLCKIEKCIINISGMDSNSASPSDTWFLQFEDTYYKNEYLDEITKIDKGFLKLFLSINDHLRRETFKKSLYGLRYEIFVYKNVISKLLDLKICTNFVNFLGVTSSCTYDNLINLLSNNVIIESTKLSNTEIENSLKNTIYNCFINSCKKRQNIARIVNKEEKKDIDESIEKEITNFDPTKYNYSMILLESIPKNTITFTQWLNQNYSNHSHEFWNILFQISCTCYTMSLSKMNHNDLHASNIFIQELKDPEIFLYYINEEKYYILTKFKVLIFDFDRAYVEFLGENKMLRESLCQKAQQCNQFVENKDIIKILCYIFKRYFIDDKNRGIKSKLLDIISRDKKVQNDLLNIYKDCVLTYFFNNAVEPTIFTECHDTLKILQQIYSQIIGIEENKVVSSISKIKIDFKNVSICNSKCFFEDGQINILEQYNCIRYYKNFEKEMREKNEMKEMKEMNKNNENIFNPDIPNFNGYTTDEVLKLLSNSK